MAMNFGAWMLAEIPAERRFAIEAEARRVETDPQAGRIAGLLLRQTYNQQEMLQAAIHEIARLELRLMEYED
jgi:hypothetical protein